MWSANLLPRVFIAANTPATTTLAVPWIRMIMLIMIMIRMMICFDYDD